MKKLTGEEASILGCLAVTPEDASLLDKVADRLGKDALLIANIIVGRDDGSTDEAAKRAAEGILNWASKQSDRTRIGRKRTCEKKNS